MDAPHWQQMYIQFRLYIRALNRMQDMGRLASGLAVPCTKILTKKSAILFHDGLYKMMFRLKNESMKKMISRYAKDASIDKIDGDASVSLSKALESAFFNPDLEHDSKDLIVRTRMVLPMKSFGKRKRSSFDDV